MKLSFFQKIFLFLNFLAAGCLLLSYLAPFINPGTFWLIAFFGLAYPVFVAVNFIFIVFWLWRKPWLALFSLIAIGGGYKVLNRFVSLHFSSEEKISRFQPVRIMSYNVRNFNLYNWRTNLEERNSMIQFIKDHQPDIVCFQEFYTEDKGTFQNISEIQQQMNLTHYVFHKALTLKKNEHWGLIIFSRFPIIRSEQIRFKNSKWNGAVLADVLLGKDTVRIFNVHLASIHLQKKDYEYIDRLTGEQEVDMSESRKILSKLKSGFIKRSQQARQIEQKIQSSPYPLIVCGDFNDTPSSFAYQTISNDLQDAFREKGLGFGQTYTGYFAPFRIDYILLHQKFKIHHVRNIKKKFSDHYPVICDFSF